MELNKVHCGDCLEYLKTMPDKSIHLILQDPPYNVTACKWEWDIMSKIDEFWEQWKRVIKDNGVIVMTAIQPFTSKLVMSNQGMFKYCWYWKKTKPNGWQHSKNKPMSIIEECCVFSKAPMGHASLLGEKRMQYNPQGVVCAGNRTITISNHGRTMGARPNQVGKEYQSFSNFPTNFLEFPNIVGKQALHPTQKPVDLGRYLIRTYTNEGDVVFDGFAGSGSFLVAAVMEGRSFVGVELAPEYCVMAESRIAVAQGS